LSATPPNTGLLLGGRSGDLLGRRRIFRVTREDLSGVDPLAAPAG
jgi:hypothetical protein